MRRRIVSAATDVAGRVSMVDRVGGAPGQPVDLHIVLGRARVRRDEADKLNRGSVVSLETLVDEPVDIVAGGRLIAKGEVLSLDGSFCIRVTQLISPKPVN